MPYTLNEQGFYQDENGNLAPGQQTPGMRANPSAAIQYDAEKDLYYNVVNGKKKYQSPSSYAGHEGVGATGQGTGHGMLDTMDKGGGAIHGTPTWNPAEGHFDVKLDMGKLLSYVAAGVITAGAISAAMGPAVGSTVASSPAATAGGVLPATTTAGSSVLGGGTSGLIAGGSGLGEGGTAGLLAGGAIPSGSALAAGGGGGTLSTLGSLTSKATTAEKLGGLLRGGGQAAGAATNAAANNRLSADEVAMRGQQNYENQFLSRAGLEAEQRKEALKDLYRASYAANRKPGPFNTAGLTPYSADYTAGLSAIEQQGLNRLQAPTQYGVNNMPTLKPFAPTPPSVGEKIGNYASPALTLGGMALDYYRNR